MSIPAGFFDGVIAEIAELYPITDGEQFVAEKNPVVKMCVRLAYQQICSFTNTTYHKDVRSVEYAAMLSPFMLMHTPLDTNVAYTVTIDLEARVAGTDFVIVDDVFYIGDSPNADQCFGFPITVKINSTAGIPVLIEDTPLYSALLFQGIANYNRRDLLGFTQITGEKGTSRSVNDKGGLLEAVKELVVPLMYHGNGRLCSS
jgi:hypothetical protein